MDKNYLEKLIIANNVNVRLSKGTLDTLKLYASEKNCNFTYIIKCAVDEYCKNHEISILMIPEIRTMLKEEFIKVYLSIDNIVNLYLSLKGNQGDYYNHVSNIVDIIYKGSTATVKRKMVQLITVDQKSCNKFINEVLETEKVKNKYDRDYESIQNLNNIMEKGN